MESLNQPSLSSLNTESAPITIEVLGTPAPQGSKTVSRWGGVRESSALVKPWRQSVAYASVRDYKGPVLDGPLFICIDFYFIRPKSHYGTGRNAGKLKNSAPIHCVKTGGDIDKLARSTLDGLSVSSGGNVIRDDRLVVGLILLKHYATDEDHAGATIKIYSALGADLNVVNQLEKLIAL